MMRSSLIPIATLLLTATVARAAGKNGSAKPLDMSRVELKHVQEIRYDKEKRPGMLVPCAVHIHKSFIYMNGVFPVKLNTFRRDPKTDLLEYVGILDTEPHYRSINKQSEHAFAHMASGKDGILYVAGHHFHKGNHSFGIHWYKIDEKTGAGKHLGSLKTPQSSGGSNAWGEVITTQGGKCLYHLDQGTRTIHWYKPDASGKPIMAGKAKGKGIISTIRNLNGARGPWAMTADEKFIYSASTDERALGWVKLAEDGKPEYGGAIDLAKPLKVVTEAGKRSKFRALKVACSSDGRHVYLWYQRPTRTRSVSRTAAVFARDPKTGAVSFIKALDLGKFGPGGGMTLTPDGKGGFMWTKYRVDYFSRDAESGDLKIEKTVRTKPSEYPSMIVASPSNRACYISDYGRYKTGAIHVFKLVEKK